MKHLGDELCLSIKSAKLSTNCRSYIVLTVVTEFFAAEFAYSKSYSNTDNLQYGHVCVLHHPKRVDFLLLLRSVCTLSF